MGKESEKDCVCISHSVVSDSLRPPGLQPARLLCLWDFPGKNTRVGSHFLLHEKKIEAYICITELFCCISETDYIVDQLYSSIKLKVLKIKMR